MPTETLVVGGEPTTELHEGSPLVTLLRAPDFARLLIALLLLALLALTVVFAFLKVSGQGWTNTQELLQVLLPAETALLGSAVGFYFGKGKDSP